MIGWVEASLYETINCLTRLGRNDLASDINRLLDTLDFDELEVFRNPVSEAVADQLLEVSTFPRSRRSAAAVLEGDRGVALHAPRGERTCRRRRSPRGR